MVSGLALLLLLFIFRELGSGLELSGRPLEKHFQLIFTWITIKTAISRPDHHAASPFFHAIHCYFNKYSIKSHYGENRFSCRESSVEPETPWDWPRGMS
jgi:hypothetical protein